MIATKTMHRSKDPTTSIDAANQIAPHTTRLQGDILSVIRQYGDITGEELVNAPELAPIKPSTIRGRMKELATLGLIEETGAERNHGKVWRAVPTEHVVEAWHAKQSGAMF